MRGSQQSDTHAPARRIAETDPDRPDDRPDDRPHCGLDSRSSVLLTARGLEGAIAELTGAKPLTGDREALAVRLASNLAELAAFAQNPIPRP